MITVDGAACLADLALARRRGQTMEALAIMLAGRHVASLPEEEGEIGVPEDSSTGDARFLLPTAGAMVLVLRYSGLTRRKLDEPHALSDESDSGPNGRRLLGHGATPRFEAITLDRRRSVAPFGLRCPAYRAQVIA